MAETEAKHLGRNIAIAVAILVVVAVGAWLFVEDWHQLEKIAFSPDNIPIVGMLFLVPFFTWLGLRQAWANDKLITKLEADPQRIRARRLSEGDSSSEPGRAFCTHHHR